MKSVLLLLLAVSAVAQVQPGSNTLQWNPPSPGPALDYIPGSLMPDQQVPADQQVPSQVITTEVPPGHRGLVPVTKITIPRRELHPNEFPPLPDSEYVSPPAPVVTLLERHQTHVAVVFTYKGPTPDAFTILRRFNDKTETGYIKSAAFLKPSYNLKTDTYTFTFVDKKVARDKAYAYVVITHVDDNSSAESNSLIVQP